MGRRSFGTGTVVLAAALLVAAGAAGALLRVQPGADGEAQADATATPRTYTPARAKRPLAPSAAVPAARELRLGFDSPQLAQPGTPRRALAEFLAAWRDGDFERMTLWTADSWQLDTPRPAAALRRQFARSSCAGRSSRRASAAPGAPSSTWSSSTAIFAPASSGA